MLVPDGVRPWPYCGVRVFSPKLMPEMWNLDSAPEPLMDNRFEVTVGAGTLMADSVAWWRVQIV